MNHTMGLFGILLYTDPGTGAMLWQLLIAALIGLVFYFRHYTGKVKVFLTTRKNKKR